MKKNEGFLVLIFSKSYILKHFKSFHCSSLTICEVCVWVPLLTSNSSGDIWIPLCTLYPWPSTLPTTQTSSYYQSYDCWQRLAICRPNRRRIFICCGWGCACRWSRWSHGRSRGRRSSHVSFWQSVEQHAGCSAGLRALLLHPVHRAVSYRDIEVPRQKVLYLRERRRDHQHPTSQIQTRENLRREWNYKQEVKQYLPFRRHED